MMTTSALLSQSISDEEMKDILLESANLLQQNYILSDIGIKYADEIEKRRSNGVFDSLKTGEEFARSLTMELQSIYPDKHLRVLSPADTKARFRSFEDSSMEEMMRRRVEQERNKNFYMDKVEVLPGNIGYFRLNQFPIPEPAKTRADAIMQFLKDTDAVILDL